MGLVIAIDDPRVDDVRSLLDRHLEFARLVTPVGHVHALEIDELLDPTVTLFSARKDGLLVGIGALKRLDEEHAEVKSMHTVEAARGQGVARAIVEHLLAFAADQHYQCVNLETGTMDAFAPARRLYTKIGFVPCEPFADYTSNLTAYA